MNEEPTETRRAALGAFLRAHRARLLPAMVGLKPGPRRRTPGLRREEIAELGGISTTWYSWMEQGREVTASAAALGRLAQALRLSRAERAYLFDLAGKRDPAGGEGPVGAAVGPALAAMIAAIAWPAYVLDRTWNASAWNPPAERLFAGWLDRAGERNLLRYIFLEPLARRLICDWEARARRVLAEFRADYSIQLDDQAAAALIEDLRRRSPFFARAWDEQAVMAREGGLRTFAHPIDGPLRFEQLTFTLAQHPEMKLVVLSGIAP